MAIPFEPPPANAYVDLRSDTIYGLLQQLERLAKGRIATMITAPWAQADSWPDTSHTAKVHIKAIAISHHPQSPRLHLEIGQSDGSGGVSRYSYPIGAQIAVVSRGFVIGGSNRRIMQIFVLRGRHIEQRS